MPDRLLIEDESLFPIQTFFNAVSDDSFVGVVDALTSGVGYSINDCHCHFPGDLDPGDEPFDGVQFSLFEQSIVISREELKSYLKLVCDEFVKRFPTERERINGLLARR